MLTVTNIRSARFQYNNDPDCEQLLSTGQTNYASRGSTSQTYNHYPPQNKLRFPGISAQPLSSPEQVEDLYGFKQACNAQQITTFEIFRQKAPWYQDSDLSPFYAIRFQTREGKTGEFNLGRIAPSLYSELLNAGGQRGPDQGHWHAIWIYPLKALGYLANKIISMILSPLGILLFGTGLLGWKAWHSASKLAKKLHK